MHAPLRPTPLAHSSRGHVDSVILPRNMLGERPIRNLPEIIPEKYGSAARSIIFFDFTGIARLAAPDTLSGRV